MATAATPQPAQALITTIPAPRQAFVIWSLVWLVKLGVLAVIGPQKI